MSQQHPFIKRLLEQVPYEERYTFTDSQIKTLHRSALSLPKSSHAVHVRWSVPFPGKGFYIVLLAGKERRSRQRLLAEKEFQLIPTTIIILTIIFSCTVVFGLSYIQRILAISQQSSSAGPDETE